MSKRLRPGWLTNRQRTRMARPAKFWCGGCDTYKVGRYQKCPNCGFRDGRPRDKR